MPDPVNMTRQRGRNTADMGTQAHAIVTNGAGPEQAPPQPRPFLRLDTSDRIRREAVRLYRAGRDGKRDVADVSKLTNCLALIQRMIEGGEVEARIARLEQLNR
jgi:hypothetical protein